MTAHPKTCPATGELLFFGARLRQHRIMPDGSNRDSVVYSIIDTEWKAAAAALRARLR